eukprot:scaffold5138_cov251-Pinguiococcus_pyrenoidosus.AAC.8
MEGLFGQVDVGGLGNRAALRLAMMIICVSDSYYYVHVSQLAGLPSVWTCPQHPSSLRPRPPRASGACAPSC